MNDIFVDRVVNVSVVAGVARIDFARIDKVDAETGKVQLSNSYRVALPVDAFLHLSEISNKVASEIAKTNTATKNPNSEVEQREVK